MSSKKLSILQDMSFEFSDNGESITIEDEDYCVIKDLLNILGKYNYSVEDAILIKNCTTLQDDFEI